MVLLYKVCNFKSICDTIEISFVGNKYNDDTQYEAYFTTEKGNRILKGIGIFGNNATGKSNIIESIGVFKKIIVDTILITENTRLSLLHPFAFSENNKNEPTTFYIEFFNEDNKTTYFYTLSLTNEIIVKEILDISLNNRIIHIFKRDEKNIEINHNHFKESDIKLIKERNLKNKPLVTFGAQFNFAILKDVYEYFLNKIFVVSGLAMPNSFGIGKKISEDKGFQEFLNSLLKASDLSINYAKSIQKEASIIPPNINKIDFSTKLEKTTIYDVICSHKVGETMYDLNFDFESLGTKKVMAFSGPIYQVLENGGLILIDEFGASMHPDLTKFILTLFFNKNINKKYSQILFNSQTTSLLNSYILRRDEIYFTDKDEKQITRLYSLKDFSVRKTDKIEQAFVNGRYVLPPQVDDSGIEL